MRGAPEVNLARLFVEAGLLLLLCCSAAWFLVYRKLQRHPTHLRYYRWHQILVAMIAALAILVPIVLVLSIDPGDNDIFWFLP